MENQEYKIGLIGSVETVMGFIALGVTCFPIKEDNEIETIIAKIKADNFAAIFITEDWAVRIRAVLDAEFAKAALPAIVTVPSQKGATEAGLANLKNIVEQAVGSDILFNK